MDLPWFILFIPLFTGFNTSQVVQDFWNIHSMLEEYSVLYNMNRISKSGSRFKIQNCHHLLPQKRCFARNYITHCHKATLEPLSLWTKTTLFMGKLSPKIPRENNKYQGYTVRGTPNVTWNIIFWCFLFPVLILIAKTCRFVKSIFRLNQNTIIIRAYVYIWAIYHINP